ncbi:DUF6261 family protein [Marinifilum fragile]|uniref:DUF6261 family protein n=1 Tax=Marinifilum fragile TaxID=570161 RepID=UPI002AA68D8D|nr:DUF6261 family protein [Marinifilum fragile]
MFLKMTFSLLLIDELLGYGNKISKYLKSLNKEGLQLDAAIAKFEAMLARALEASNRSKSSDFTSLLHEKDFRRDESYLAFRNFMEACMHRNNETVANAGGTICRIIRGHGWSLHAGGRKNQSAKMASLSKELNSEANQALIEAAGGKDWYTEMLTDNAAYESLTEAKSVDEIKKEDYNMDQVYKNLRLACEELFDTIEVLNRIAPNEKYEDIAAFVNECSQEYITVARARKTKSAKEKIEEQEA